MTAYRTRSCAAAVPPGAARQILAHLAIDVCPASLGLCTVIDYAVAARLTWEHERRSRTAAQIDTIYRVTRGRSRMATDRSPLASRLLRPPRALLQPAV